MRPSVFQSLLPERGDFYFLFLRIFTLLGGIAWYLLVPYEAERRNFLAWLLGAYAFYTVCLYALVILRPAAIRILYLVTLAVDLGFVYMLILHVGRLRGSFFIAYYLLTAVHSFYFGLKVGLPSALVISALYLSSYYRLNGPVVIPWPDLILRISFLFLIALSLGLLSDREKRMRKKLLELNQELSRKNAILEQTYRHLSIGKLIGEIAEGINGPLGTISLRSEFLMAEARDRKMPAEFARGLEVMHRCSHQVAQVVRSLLAFSKQEYEQQALNFNELVEDALLLTERGFKGKNITVQKQLEPQLPSVLGDSSELKGVLISLISNAIDALPKGGTIRLYTRTSFAEGRSVICEVHDNGTGIPEEDLEIIFNPFFTTKAKTGGIGLGLSTSLSVMKKHNGLIAVRSLLGKGSVFTMSLPAFRPALPVRKGAA
ncbi:MAG: HAMP domain-containing histidine kinase [Acidobacteria bacterium]|nr:HAMP domain-containing histidine kinase [Acidobacteriota bacterium]